MPCRFAEGRRFDDGGLTPLGCGLESLPFTAASTPFSDL